VIEAFADSWGLFADTYLAGWAVAVLLSLVGVWVVARDQIFLGAAVSQASTLGTAFAIWLQGVTVIHAFESDAVTFFFAVTASFLTALVSARPSRSGRESAEAITGWIFLVGSTIPVLLLVHNPHGLEEVHRILFSSILGASRADVWLFGGLLLISLVTVARLRDRIVLYAMDPEMAGAVGMRLPLWRVGMAAWLGVVVGLSIHSAGMIYSFGCLVLPAMAARKLCREVRPMFVVAPALGLTTAVLAFVVAHTLDLPPAQLAVAFQCGVLALAWAWSWIRRGSWRLTRFSGPG
jgi:ABC-type Mn2+/Zn2+ transport system permease subunit